MKKIENKINLKNFNNKRAYTLVELSIVILIISLLMAGVFSMATGSINSSKESLTNQRIKEIYKSLGTYLMVNKRLPCPASLTKSKINDIDYGEELRAGNSCTTGSGVYASNTTDNSVSPARSLTNLLIGAVPIKSLNLSSEYLEDAYENKISYVIDSRFTKNFIGPIGGDIDVSFGTIDATEKIMTTKEIQIGGEVTLSENVIFLLISHGANGFGAFDINGQQIIDNSNNTDDGELNNQLALSASINFDHNFIVNSFKSDKFDDIVFYKTRSNFIQDFSANNLICCKKPSNSGTFPQVNLYQGQYLYDSVTCSDNKIIRIIKCSNISGEWSYVLSQCPGS